MLGSASIIPFPKMPGTRPSMLCTTSVGVPRSRTTFSNSIFTAAGSLASHAYRRTPCVFSRSCRADFSGFLAATPTDIPLFENSLAQLELMPGPPPTISAMSLVSCLLGCIMRHAPISACLRVRLTLRSSDTSVGRSPRGPVGLARRQLFACGGQHAVGQSRIVNGTREDQRADHCSDNGERLVLGLATAWHQASDPFHDHPHGVREAVPNRALVAWNLTRQGRHHAAIPTSFPMIRGQVPSDIVVQRRGVPHACRTRAQGMTQCFRGQVFLGAELAVEAAVGQSGSICQGIDANA